MVNDGTPCRVDLFISFDLNQTIKIIKKKITCSFKALCDLYDTFNLQFKSIFMTGMLSFRSHSTN